MFVATEYDVSARLVLGLHRAKYEHVGCVSSADEAVAAVGELTPDVVLIHLLTTSGLTAVRRIARSAPVVVVSSVPPEEVLLTCVAIGVRGFVSLPEVDEVLEEAVAAVAAGGTYLGEWAVPSTGAAPSGSRRRIQAPADAAASLLSARQVEILSLVADGRRVGHIAAALGLTPNTVKTHLRRAMAKLGVRSAREAASMVDAGGRGEAREAAVGGFDD